MTYRITAALVLAVLAASVLAADPAATTAPATNSDVPIHPSVTANLALVATASASFVSGDQTVTAINSGYSPRNSNDASHLAYGNWPNFGTQWVEYDWAQPIATNRVEVYWYADGRGIKLPKAARLKYWDGNAFVPIKDANSPETRANRFNSSSFPEITTSKIRLEFDSAGASADFSTGLLQFRVFDSGHSPAFPPIIHADVERSVVLPTQTFLHAGVKSMNPAAPSVLTWSKTTGPGDVTFADAHSPDTTATFTTPGDYTLTLSAAEGALSSSGSTLVHVATAANVPRLEPVYTKAYTLNSPIWDHRIKNIITTWIPHCIDKLSDLHLKEGGIANFIEAGKANAGQPAALHVGPPWCDAYVLNTIESMCVALQVNPQGDAELVAAQKAYRAKLEEWIPIVLAAQEPDGYLQTRFTLDPRHAAHWNARTRGEHEGYIGGYLIEAGIGHYLATDGKDLRLFNAAKKLADCWDNNIGPGKKEWFDGHEEIEQALVRLGRFVNDVEAPGKGDRYIALAKFLLDCRKNGSTYDQSQLPVTQQYEAVGHSVRAAYVYSAMTDIAMETHDPAYASAVNSIWDNLVNKKYYVTGGIGSGETSEGFGPNYSLRNNGYCESCSNCGELFFQYKMNLASHDAKYVDLYEDTLYNAILGDLDLEGKNFYYQNPLVNGDRGGARYSWHDCPCCVGNIPRVLLALPTWMYSKSAADLYVNLYIGSTVTIDKLADTDVQIVQTTDYPWTGNVKLTINPRHAAAFALHVRLPHYGGSRLYAAAPALKETEVVVNGIPLTDTAADHGYATIARTWNRGDTVTLNIPLQPQRIKADDHILADRSHVALRYGPVIFNIESADNQNVDSVLKSGTPVTPEFNPKLLDGVLTLKSNFSDETPLLAIPNYARNNRGGRSMVWIKDQ